MDLKPIRVDASVCTGCRACEAACVFFHDAAAGTSSARIRIRKDEAEGLDEPRLCRLCAEPSCLEACPAGALRRDAALGVIRLDPGLCTACGVCAGACPHGAIALDPRDGRPLICDLCGGGEPACVSRCSPGALRSEPVEVAEDVVPEGSCCPDGVGKLEPQDRPAGYSTPAFRRRSGRDPRGQETPSGGIPFFSKGGKAEPAGARLGVPRRGEGHGDKSLAGRVLRVDLTSGSLTSHPLEEDLVRAFIGGRGLNVKRLWDELPAHTDGVSPENLLVFGVGPLAGTLLPGGARFNVSAMSPQTGILGDSNAGGTFGPSLKFAGFDQIVVRGRAAHPVYLWIDGGRAELRDARPYWGLDVWETTAAIRREIGDPSVDVAAVGPGAENGVRFAGIFANLVRAAARTGMGTVMAAKNLKAVAVRGSGLVPVADPTELGRLLARIDERIYKHPDYPGRSRLGTTRLIKSLEAIGGLPTRHFQSGHFEHAEAVSGETIAARYKVKSKACFACTVHCSRFLRVDDPRFPGLRTEGPEFEPLAGFTARVGNGDLALGLAAVDLANRLGLDAIALSEVIAWSMECAQRGLLSREEADGLDLSWGNGATILSMIHKVARREGFGDLLADGVRRAAERLGRGSEAIAFHGKGLEIFQADIRAIKAYGLGNAVSSRGADHLRSEPWFEFSGDAAEGIRRYGIPETAFRLEHKGKGLVVKHFEEMAAVADATGFCKNLYNNMEVMDWEETAAWLRAAAGLDVDGEEVRRAGERIVNLERLFDAREGIGRRDDGLPGRFLKEPLDATGESRGAVLELEPMLDEYYRARGWDTVTGLPLPEKLRDLGFESGPARALRSPR